MPDRREALTWSQIERDAKDLAGQIARRGTFNGIIAIARGGLVPAAIVAGVLDIRTVHVICARGYDAGERRDRVVIGEIHIAPVMTRGSGFVVIDDLVDSGRTMRAVRAELPLALTAVLYAKPLGESAVDLFKFRVDEALWIDFPWEPLRGGPGAAT